MFLIDHMQTRDDLYPVEKKRGELVPKAWQQIADAAVRKVTAANVAEDTMGALHTLQWRRLSILAAVTMRRDGFVHVNVGCRCNTGGNCMTDKCPCFRSNRPCGPHCHSTAFK